MSYRHNFLVCKYLEREREREGQTEREGGREGFELTVVFGRV